MLSKEAIKSIAEWVLPPQIQRLAEDHLLWRSTMPLGLRPMLRENAHFRDLHKGQRCFILCNGPSINQEDLLPLRTETCFSVSNFYKHSQYQAIAPKYHCVPNVLPPHTEGGIVQWFGEMNAHLGGAEVFLGSRQYALVHERNLFADRQVHFVHMQAGQVPNNQNIDITRGVARVISVPIMCMIIALYMGFSRIYLLGTDHSSLFTGEYHYFFDRSQMVLKDPYTSDNGKNNYDLILEFTVHLQLWKQYSALHKLASERGAEIINLAAGSYLDVFPRARLTEVLRG